VFKVQKLYKKYSTENSTSMTSRYFTEHERHTWWLSGNADQRFRDILRAVVSLHNIILRYHLEFSECYKTYWKRNITSLQVFGL